MNGSGSRRLAHTGRLGKRAISVSFNGQTLAGLEGDTLASCLLANGIHAIGRSFKLHRLRGIVACGEEEPNALVTVGAAEYTEPNIKATMLPVAAGLAAKSQNHWPSLGVDVGALNQVFSRFLPAGFYYKTFIGPVKNSWKWYEPIVRKSAGLGAGTHHLDPDHYEVENTRCDVLVIGSGPAGLAACVAASQWAERVILIEQQAQLGGQLLAEDVDSVPEQWRLARVQHLRQAPNVTILSRTTAFGWYDGGMIGAVEHLSTSGKGGSRQRLWHIKADRIILAAGAIERPLLFANNDKPGVMLAAAVRRYIHHFAVLPGQHAVVYTNNDSAYASALALKHAGADVRVIDTRAQAGESARKAVQAEGIDVLFDAQLVAAQGLRHVRQVQVRQGGRTSRLPCDLVCVSGGWSPTVHLSSHRGHKPVFNEALQAFVPAADLPPELRVAGSVTGTLDTAQVLAQGWQAGQHAEQSVPLPAWDELLQQPSLASIAPLLTFPQGLSKAQQACTFVDLQHDVALSDIKLAVAEGYESVEHLKRYTTLGMGTDQGRTSNVNGLSVLASMTQSSIADTGTTTFRPPYTPVTMGALAGRLVQRNFRPRRLTPMHDWHMAHGGAPVMAGEWMRPWHYRSVTEAEQLPEANATHEMRQVRASVGMVDISTLGKILVQGPDATELLSRVYANRWHSLAVGKARYGVMLHRDGFIMDDGTTTRLSEHSYFMTTTTANAARIMSHLEYVLAVIWPELRVVVTSVTDQWGGFAVAGPNSLKTLQKAFPDLGLSDAGLPVMGLVEHAVQGTIMRIIRLSFSGERAYEIYTHAPYTLSFWKHILAAGETFGMLPYGTRAMDGLRIEKGHPAGGELDNRSTLDDLGLARMAKKDGPYIGKILRTREHLTSPQRRTLVGLLPEDSSACVDVGAVIFVPGEEHNPSIGHVTSATYSPTRQSAIALALVENGNERMHSTVLATSFVHDRKVRCKVVSPIFVDPEGENIHA